MDTGAAKSAPSLFATYLEIPTRLPQWVWWVLRLATIGFTFGMAALLVIDAPKGLDLFWKLVIPLLPLTFALIPGFWRQVCPMALANQLPRVFGFSRQRTLPMALKVSAYLISVLLFFGAVLLRPLVFNLQAPALLVLILGSLVLAFIGGVVFKGRSGWCGTFCPLAPIQKAYGHSPPVLVKNGYCPTCVGCQKNCYDFNPRAALHTDLADADSWYSGHREFFVAALPGLILGFFTAPSPTLNGAVAYFTHMGLYITLALGLFMALTRIVRISRYRSALGFAMAAFLLFYWFASPVLAGGIAEFSGLAIPGAAGYVFFAAAGLVAAKIVLNGLRDERAFARLTAPAEPQVGVDLPTLRAAGAPQATADVVLDNGSGRSFAALPGRTLLEGLESAGVKIDYGCRMGMCGADPITIVDGHDCLSEPGSTELETLDRLGLRGRARMACVCKAQRGGVTIDTKLDPRTLPEPVPDEPLVDMALSTGVKRVVIIGNGAAGVAAADEVRRLSPSCTIELVAREPELFYNRMAIARLLYGRSAMAGLYLQTPDWQDKKNISVWLNTSVTSIDPQPRSVQLGTGESLPYDKLVLAQGSRAAAPDVPGADLPGCFVLREARDAINIRAYRQSHSCRTAVVVGGGVLGIEAADAMRQLGLEVTILQRSSRLMNRQLDDRGSSILTRYLQGLGVHVITGVEVVRCEGGDRLTGITLTDGQVIEADIMVACAGIIPNIQIAANAGLATNHGIIVDRAMRTSDPDILAIGDVAELPGAAGGLWAVSSTQGRLAAATLFGKAMDYDEPNTMVSLKVEGIDIRGYGHIAPQSETEEILVDPTNDDDTHRAIVTDGQRLIGAIFVGPPGTGNPVTELVERRHDISDLLIELRSGNWTSIGGQ